MQSNGISIVGGEAISADLPHGHGDPERRPSRRSGAAAPEPGSGEQRLEIRQDPETLEWIYTVTDRVTGDVIAQLTREDVARLGLTPDYAAGALVRASA